VGLLQSHSPDRRTHLLKTTREHLNIIDAYHQLGSYRAAALACGTTDKTVKRAIERQQAGDRDQIDSSEAINQIPHPLKVSTRTTG
jgi:hypothetical protein